MVLHYLKISLRNLLKYKTHSLISAICLAVGIVCYALICFFVQQQEKLADLPNCERRLRIEISQSESSFFRSHEVKRMEEQTVDGLECVTIHSYGNSTEIEVIDDEQRNLPFLIRYKGINANTSHTMTGNYCMVTVYPRHQMKWSCHNNSHVKPMVTGTPSAPSYTSLILKTYRRTRYKTSGW